MSKLKAVPDKKRALFKAPEGVKVGVDRERKVLLGYVVAQEGEFKSEGRGEFDKDGVREIARLMNAAPNGLKSRFAHPGLSSDGIGRFLGRAKSARVETGRRETAQGRKAVVDFVRADLHFAEIASKAPEGDLAGYVMDLADEDPGAVSSSLVIEPELIFRKDEKNRPLKGPDGEELPPLWLPKRLFASDIVDEGDAVHGPLLSAEALDWDSLPDALVRQAWAMLDRQFEGADRAVIEARCFQFLSRYLDDRFGPASPPEPPRPPALPEGLALRLERMAVAAKEMRLRGRGS